MFWSKNKKKKVYNCKPQFYYINVGFKGIYIARTCFPDEIKGEILEYARYKRNTKSFADKNVKKLYAALKLLRV